MTNANDSAFTNTLVINRGDAIGEYKCASLTKREYFAAMAMQGLLASNGDNDEGWNAFSLADDAVLSADALINALNRPDDVDYLTEGDRRHEEEGK